ncbi:IS3 family transposase [Glutamicibacter sp.]|uniref:IS3 family transposase n=1 Tax=Glutamicibacter sp. TaxID=1931995 RepID=UPI0028BD3516|nr:IS3 family transposase [Glutamicibacter sp.]
MKVSARTYRGWKQRQPASRAITDAQILNVLHDLQQPDSKTGRPKPEVLYGRRKMRAWLQRHGFPDVSKHTVDRLMRDTGMNGLVRGRRTVTTIRAKDKVRAKDLLNRNFFTNAPDKVWITDFTYVPTRNGFTYMSFVIDLFSRRILSWASSTSHDTEFVEEALRLALWQRRKGSGPHKSPVQGTIHHSHAGSQYTSQRYTQKLAVEGLVPSIGSIGDAFDNAAAETVMGLFKNEAVARDSPFRQGPLTSKPDVDDVVVEWVHWYNNCRLHSTLGYRSPVEFEELYYDEINGALPDVAASKLAA